VKDKDIDEKEKKLVGIMELRKCWFVKKGFFPGK